MTRSVFRLFRSLCARSSCSKRNRLALQARPKLEILEERTVPTVQAVSVSDPSFLGASGHGPSGQVSASADGQFIAFQSDAGNLTPNDHNGKTDVFVRNVATGDTTLVSATPDGMSGDARSFNPVISADGTTVAFLSYSSDLAGNTRGHLGLYVRNLTTGTTTLATVDANGNHAGVDYPDLDPVLGAPVLSADGRFVAFLSELPDLVNVVGDHDGDVNTSINVYLSDVQAGSIELISQNRAGTDRGEGDSGQPAISADGRYVAFVSFAGNLTVSDANDDADVFVRDRLTRTTNLVSIDRATQLSAGGAAIEEPLALSPDGRFLAFVSRAGNLTDVPTPGGYAQVYVRDLHQEVTRLVSVAEDGSQAGNGASVAPSLSTDGQFVAFESAASNLVGVGFGVREINVYLRGMGIGGTTQIVSANARGESGDDYSGRPVLSPNGRWVSFVSSANNLTAGTVTAEDYHVLADTQGGVLSVLGPVARNDSPFETPRVALTASGLVAFTSAQGDLVPDDNNQTEDVFLRHPSSASVSLVSARSPAMPGPYTSNGQSFAARSSVSAHGTRVLFSSTGSNLNPGALLPTWDSSLYLRDLSTQTTTLISARRDGSRGEGYGGLLSTDGQVVIFASQDDGLVLNRGGWDEQLYAHDLRTGITTLVSVNRLGLGVQGNVASYALSGNGRFVVFWSDATDLATDPIDGGWNLFVRDLVENSTTLVTVSADGQGRGSQYFARPTISDDGNFIAFGSTARGLTPVDPGATAQVYLRDVAGETTTLISQGTEGAGNGSSFNPVISPDGSRIAFLSTADNLSAVSPQLFEGLYVHDRVLGTLRLVTLTPDGSTAAEVRVDAESISFADEGRLLVFASHGNELVPNDFSSGSDVFVHDVLSQSTTLVSANFNPESVPMARGVNGSSYAPQVSADGRFVTFLSSATDLVDNDGHSPDNLYVRDRLSGRTTLVSTNFAGGRSSGDIFDSQLSSDGSTIVFGSRAEDLASGDLNGMADVFVLGIPRDELRQPDLMIQFNTNPISVRGGDQIPLTWQVTNVGTRSAQGPWQDAVYLSPTPALDASARLFTTLTHSEDLAPGHSYLTTATVELPSVLPGEYYLIVTTDRSHRLPDLNRENNTQPGNAFTLAVPELLLDVPTSDQFIGGTQSRTYQITLSEGANLLLTLDSAASSGGTELYVRRQDVPTPSTFSWSSREPGQPDQHIVIPATEAGDYFVLVRSRSGPARTSAFTLTAVFATELTLLSVTPAPVSNSGRVTLELHGVHFTEHTRASLHLGELTLNASAHRLADSTRLYATFDLTGSPAGNYDVRIQDGSATANLTAKLAVTATGRPGRLGTRVIAPEVIRSGRDDVVLVEYFNDGDSEIPAPLLILSAQNAQLQTPGTNTFSDGEVLLVGVNPQGVPGKLPPGFRGVIRVPFRTDSNNDAQSSTFTLTIQNNPEELFDWATLADLGGPPGTGTNFWESAVAAARLRIGETWGDVLAAVNQGPAIDPRQDGPFTFPEIGYSFVARLRYLVALEGAPQHTNAGLRQADEDTDLVTEVLYVSAAGVTVSRVGAADGHLEPGRHTYLITPGLSGHGERYQDLAESLAESQPDANVLLVDWSPLAPLVYTISASQFASAYVGGIDVVTTANDLFDFFKELHDQGLFEPTESMFIGESFGNFVNDRLAVRLRNADLGQVRDGLFFNLPQELTGYQLTLPRRVSTVGGGGPLSRGVGLSTLDGFEFSVVLVTCSVFDTKQKVGNYTVELRLEDALEDAELGVEWLDVRLEAGDTTWLDPRTKNLGKAALDHWDGRVEYLNSYQFPEPRQIHTCFGGEREAEEPEPELPEDTEDGGEGITQHRRSSDPNDLIGPAGFGAAHFVAPQQTLAYTIRFENDPHLATAPAQEVIVTLPLDTDLDVTTFEFGSFQFGDIVVTAPTGQQSFTTSVLTTNLDGTPLQVDISAEVDITTGVASWAFRSVDPLTGQLPPGVLDGFLPVNDATGRGQGSVTFTVRPRADLATGTEIRGVAAIVFDTNGAIATNQANPHDPSQGTDPNKEGLVTIDAGSPTCSVTALPASTGATSFLLSWGGADDPGGSGVARYELFVSTDGGPFAPYLLSPTNTTSVFRGAANHSYAFYSIATDNVGNREVPPTQPQAVTQVVAANTTVRLTTPIVGNAGQPVKLTAIVNRLRGVRGKLTGSVTFVAGNMVLGTAPLKNVNGVFKAKLATTALDVGVHSLEAIYGGNSGLTSANSVVRSIHLVSLTTTTLVSATPLAVTGAPIAFTATVAATAQGGVPTGSVSFFDVFAGVRRLLGTVEVDAAGQATLTTTDLLTGVHTVVARYNPAPNSDFIASKSAGINQTVNRKPAVVALREDASPELAALDALFARFGEQREVKSWSVCHRSGAAVG